MRPSASNSDRDTVASRRRRDETALERLTLVSEGLSAVVEVVSLVAAACIALLGGPAVRSVVPGYVNGIVSDADQARLNPAAADTEGCYCAACQLVPAFFVAAAATVALFQGVLYTSKRHFSWSIGANRTESGLSKSNIEGPVSVEDPASFGAAVVHPSPSSSLQPAASQANVAPLSNPFGPPPVDTLIDANSELSTLPSATAGSSHPTPLSVRSVGNTPLGSTPIGATNTTNSSSGGDIAASPDIHRSTSMTTINGELISVITQRATDAPSPQVATTGASLPMFHMPPSSRHRTQPIVVAQRFDGVALVPAPPPYAAVPVSTIIIAALRRRQDAITHFTQCYVRRTNWSTIALVGHRVVAPLFIILAACVGALIARAPLSAAIALFTTLHTPTLVSGQPPASRPDGSASHTGTSSFPSPAPLTSDVTPTPMALWVRYCMRYQRLHVLDLRTGVRWLMTQLTLSVSLVIVLVALSATQNERLTDGVFRSGASQGWSAARCLAMSANASIAIFNIAEAVDLAAAVAAKRSYFGGNHAAEIAFVAFCVLGPLVAMSIRLAPFLLFASTDGRGLAVSSVNRLPSSLPALRERAMMALLFTDPDGMPEFVEAQDDDDEFGQAPYSGNHNDAHDARKRRAAGPIDFRAPSVASAINPGRDDLQFDSRKLGTAGRGVAESQVESTTAEQHHGTGSCSHNPLTGWGPAAGYAAGIAAAHVLHVFNLPLPAQSQSADGGAFPPSAAAEPAGGAEAAMQALDDAKTVLPPRMYHELSLMLGNAFVSDVPTAPSIMSSRIAAGFSQSARGSRIATHTNNADIDPLSVIEVFETDLFESGSNTPVNRKLSESVVRSSQPGGAIPAVPSAAAATSGSTVGHHHHPQGGLFSPNAPNSAGAGHCNVRNTAILAITCDELEIALQSALSTAQIQTITSMTSSGVTSPVNVPPAPLSLPHPPAPPPSNAAHHPSLGDVLSSCGTSTASVIAPFTPMSPSTKHVAVAVPNPPPAQHGGSGSNSIQHVQQLFDIILKLCVNTASASGELFLPAAGNIILIAWGVTSGWADAASCACQVALALSTKVARFHPHRLNFRMGVAVGPTCCLQNSDRSVAGRYVRVLGPTMWRSVELARQAKSLGLATLVDHNCADRVANSHILRPVDVLRAAWQKQAGQYAAPNASVNNNVQPSTSTAASLSFPVGGCWVVSEIVNALPQVDVEEWMYVMQENDARKSESLQKYSVAFEFFAKGDVKTARDLFAAIARDHPNSPESAHSLRLQARCDGILLNVVSTATVMAPSTSVVAPTSHLPSAAHTPSRRDSTPVSVASSVPAASIVMPVLLHSVNGSFTATTATPAAALTSSSTVSSKSHTSSDVAGARASHVVARPATI